MQLAASELVPQTEALRDGRWCCRGARPLGFADDRRYLAAHQERRGGHVHVLRTVLSRLHQVRPNRRATVKSYSQVPARLLACLYDSKSESPSLAAYCAGFELKQWRCEPLADHIMEWIADYALIEDELRVSHANMYVRLKEAAARVYKSAAYKARGEVGEIMLHAICRDFFGTIPFAPRVFYLTSSNDVVKSFDMVHVLYKDTGEFELWLGEAKFYKDPIEAVTSAIKSVQTHIDAGFLKNEKLLLGPQISKDIPQYEEIRSLFSVQTSLDKLFSAAVFPICIACDSKAVQKHTSQTKAYVELLEKELRALQKKIVDSGLTSKTKVMLIYVPLGSKDALAAAFDKKLKGIAA